MIIKIKKIKIKSLGLDNLYGTNLLRAYMHGFFIDSRLYEKAKSIANPFAYEEYKKKMDQEKVEKERATRISIQRKRLPKINRELAEKILKETSEEEVREINFIKKKRKKKKKKEMKRKKKKKKEKN